MFIWIYGVNHKQFIKFNAWPYHSQIFFIFKKTKTIYSLYMHYKYFRQLILEKKFVKFIFCYDVTKNISNDQYLRKNDYSLKLTLGQKK